MNTPFPYLLETKLGQGGMGSVYRARDRRSGRHVALKLLDGAVNGPRLARFQREGELTARLDHPGIVRVHEAGVHEGRPLAVGRAQASERGHVVAWDAGRAVVLREPLPALWVWGVNDGAWEELTGGPQERMSDVAVHWRGEVWELWVASGASVWRGVGTAPEALVWERVWTTPGGRRVARVTVGEAGWAAGGLWGWVECEWEGAPRLHATEGIEVRALELSRRGGLALVGGNRVGGRLGADPLWWVERGSGAVVGEVSEHRSWNAGVFSADGERVYAIDNTARLRVFSVADPGAGGLEFVAGEIERELYDPLGFTDWQPIRALALDERHGLIYTGSSDFERARSYVRVWDLETREEVEAVWVEEGVSSLALGGEGALLLVGYEGGGVEVWGAWPHSGDQAP